jgi:hypothetical protein
MRTITWSLAGLLLVLGLFVAAPGAALAQPGAQARPLTIAPTSGPAGTTFTITGSGFTAGPVIVTVSNVATNTEFGRREVTIAAGGTLSVTYDSSGDPAGTYRVNVNGGAGTQGALLAEGTFTVTAGGAPALPNAGAGGLARAGAGPQAVLLGLGGVALLALTAGLVLRRRAA